MLSNAFIQERKQELLKRKAELEEELKGYSAHTELGGSLEDNAEEYTLDSTNREIMDRIQKDLDKIHWALAKIEDGTYGTDVDGKVISQERLKVIPWADKAI